MGSATEEEPALACVETADLPIYGEPFVPYYEGNHMRYKLMQFKLWVQKAWSKFCGFWKGVWKFIVDLFKHPKDVIIPVLFAEAVFWSPVWISAILAIFFSPWWWTVVGAVIAFWAGPFTPAIAI